jgi:hypothetical protein
MDAGYCKPQYLFGQESIPYMGKRTGSVSMLEASQDRVKLLKAGMNIKTIEKLYLTHNNFKMVQCSSRKENCWEFMKCGRELGGEKVNELGICPTMMEDSADGLNRGINGGRICWTVAGTSSGRKIEGVFAKEFAEKQSSCRDCGFFKKVCEEEGIEHFHPVKPE